MLERIVSRDRVLVALDPLEVPRGEFSLGLSSRTIFQLALYRRPNSLHQVGPLVDGTLVGGDGASGLPPEPGAPTQVRCPS